jgi:LysM repeat protein
MLPAQNTFLPRIAARRVGVQNLFSRNSPRTDPRPKVLRRLRAGRALALALVLALALTPTLAARAENITHVVQPGENLYRIGLAYGVSWRDIMTANGLHTTFIYSGQVLIIPGSAVAASAPAAPSVPAASAVPTVPAPPPAAPAGVYIVQRGDNLSLIAQRYSLSVTELMQANGLTHPNLIYPGQTLALSGATGHWLSVAGHYQALPLDCESRSAADWAGYFGVSLNELEFFNALPVSDDPDTGFVGNVRGAWGQTPPYAYGVHAEPIAALLRAYGVNARAASGLDWDTLRTEIDQNRPVIVWVVGHVGWGAGFPYTASNGHTTLVAPFEHTVMVTGYGADTVTVRDGAMAYTRSLAQFMASWGALGNQAVLGQ